MFPSQEIVSSITQLDTNSKITSGGKSPQFDFDLGDFVVVDGKVTMVKSLKALKTWIKKTLKTEKNKYKIYNTDNVEKYGVDLLKILMLKQPLTYIEAQVETIVTNALMRNNDIKSVNNFIFIKDKNLLNCTFTVDTIYGSIEESVVR